MQQNIKLIPLDIENEDHVRTLYSVRTHPEVVSCLRGPPPANYADHVRYLRNLSVHKKFFLVQQNSSLCGYCQLTHTDNHVEIGMALHPDFCNRGIGSKALSLLVEYLLQNESTQNKKLFLYVKKDNARAIALYSKFGFERIGNENEYGEYLMAHRNG